MGTTPIFKCSGTCHTSFQKAAPNSPARPQKRGILQNAAAHATRRSLVERVRAGIYHGCNTARRLLPPCRPPLVRSMGKGAGAKKRVGARQSLHTFPRGFALRRNDAHPAPVPPAPLPPPRCPGTAARLQCSSLSRLAENAAVSLQMPPRVATSMPPPALPPALPAAIHTGAASWAPVCLGR